MSKILGRRVRRTRLERRLAAIVAADVVGYSRLMGLDEEETVHRLRALQATIEPIVEADGGRIFNTAGDRMLFEFSSTVAALKSALAIQEVVGLLNRDVESDDKMLLRIGINMGDVIDGGGDVFGEVVNVASRLEAIAEPGGICVSHACYLDTKRQFAVNFADLGEQRLKNIADPIRAYAVRRPRPAGLAQTVPSRSAAPLLPPLSALPSSAQGEVAADPAPDPTNGDAFAAGAIVAGADPRQAKGANVVPWPGRRRA